MVARGKTRLRGYAERRRLLQKAKDGASSDSSANFSHASKRNEAKQFSASLSDVELEESYHIVVEPRKSGLIPFRKKKPQAPKANKGEPADAAISTPVNDMKHAISTPFRPFDDPFHNWSLKVSQIAKETSTEVQENQAEKNIEVLSNITIRRPSASREPARGAKAKEEKGAEEKKTKTKRNSRLFSKTGVSDAGKITRRPGKRKSYFPQPVTIAPRKRRPSKTYIDLLKNLDENMKRLLASTASSKIIVVNGAVPEGESARLQAAGAPNSSFERNVREILRNDAEELAKCVPTTRTPCAAKAKVETPPRVPLAARNSMEEIARPKSAPKTRAAENDENVEVAPRARRLNFDAPTTTTVTPIVPPPAGFDSASASPPRPPETVEISPPFDATEVRLAQSGLVTLSRYLRKRADGAAPRQETQRRSRQSKRTSARLARKDGATLVDAVLKDWETENEQEPAATSETKATPRKDVSPARLTASPVYSVAPSPEIVVDRGDNAQNEPAVNESSSEPDNRTEEAAQDAMPPKEKPKPAPRSRASKSAGKRGAKIQKAAPVAEPAELRAPPMTIEPDAEEQNNNVPTAKSADGDGDAQGVAEDERDTRDKQDKKHKKEKKAKKRKKDKDEKREKKERRKQKTWQELEIDVVYKPVETTRYGRRIKPSIHTQNFYARQEAMAMRDRGRGKKAAKEKERAATAEVNDVSDRPAPEDVPSASSKDATSTQRPAKKKANARKERDVGHAPNPGPSDIAPAKEKGRAGRNDPGPSTSSMDSLQRAVALPGLAGVVLNTPPPECGANCPNSGAPDARAVPTREPTRRKAARSNATDRVVPTKRRPPAARSDEPASQSPLAYASANLSVDDASFVIMSDAEYALTDSNAHFDCNFMPSHSQQSVMLISIKPGKHYQCNDLPSKMQGIIHEGKGSLWYKNRERALAKPGTFVAKEHTSFRLENTDRRNCLKLFLILHRTT